VSATLFPAIAPPFAVFGEQPDCPHEDLMRGA
jgi:hypothetical protein